jgi:cobalt-zinc-cadmium efflux system membrane fusion protein
MKRLFGNVVLAAIAAAAIAFFAFNLGNKGAVTPAKEEHAHAHEKEEPASSVDMSDAKIAAAGIELLKAGPGVLRDSLLLNGILQPNQEALVQVTPRFSGVVREIRKRVGDQVDKGELLAKIESNQSLTVYEMRAPIAGTIIDRQISLGEYASEQKPSFTVADISTVWVDLSVFRRDLPRVKVGDTVVIDIGDGGPSIEVKLSYISPVGNADTQSALARATVPNDQARLKPGLFVTARLILSAKQAPVVVRNSAIQTIDNRNVVFVRNGSKFEARDVELGSRDAEQVEILFGVADGETYAGKNSFVVKAEIGKGTAAHEH